jgi:hypothetical protein
MRPALLAAFIAFVIGLWDADVLHDGAITIASKAPPKQFVFEARPINCFEFFVCKALS